MKKETREWVEAHAITSKEACDVLDSDVKLRAKVRDLKARVRNDTKALAMAVEEFQRRNESPWAAHNACVDALAFKSKRRGRTKSRRAKR